MKWVLIRPWALLWELVCPKQEQLSIYTSCISTSAQGQPKCGQMRVNKQKTSCMWRSLVESCSLQDRQGNHRPARAAHSSGEEQCRKLGSKNSCSGLPERIKRPPHTHRETKQGCCGLQREEKNSASSRGTHPPGSFPPAHITPLHTAPCSSPRPAGHHPLPCPIVPKPAA